MSKHQRTGSGSVGDVSDLLIVVAVVVGMLAVTGTPPVVFDELPPLFLPTPIRVILGFVFVFLLPGHAITSALFATIPTQGQLSDTHSWPRRLGVPATFSEWLVFTVGLSIVSVPLTVLVVNFLPIPITEQNVIGAVSTVILLSTLIAIVRRLLAEPSQRVSTPYRTISDTIGAHLSGGPSIAAVVVACSLLAAGIAGATLAFPEPGERYTELYLLGTDEDTGELVAGNYPEQVGPDGQMTLTIGLTNKEHERTSYTVLVELYRLQTRDGTETILERDRLDQFETTLSHNETWRRSHTMSPTMAGENLRLTYLLYEGKSPENPSRQNAYRTVHLWINSSR